MSACLDVFVYECKHCNYEADAKSQRLWDTIDRLHKKKCKKTGRTEEGGVKEVILKKIKSFKSFTHGKAEYVQSGGDTYRIPIDNHINMLEGGIKARKKKFKFKKINPEHIAEIDMGHEVGIGMEIRDGNELRKWKTTKNISLSSDDETPLQEPYNKYESDSE